MLEKKNGTPEEFDPEEFDPDEVDPDEEFDSVLLSLLGIDTLETANDGKDLLLGLYDDLEWVGEETWHMNRLCERVGECLDFWKKKRYRHFVGKKKFRDCIIVIDFKYAPTEEAKRMIAELDENIRKYHMFIVCVGATAEEEDPGWCVPDTDITEREEPKLHINEPGSIDGMAILADNRTFGMWITDDLPWDEEGEHLLALQEKLNLYANFWDSKERRKYCPRKIKECCVEIRFLYPPTEKALEFIEIVGDQLEEYNMFLQYCMQEEE